jgi:hypothetical protein
MDEIKTSAPGGVPPFAENLSLATRLKAAGTRYLGALTTGRLSSEKREITTEPVDALDRLDRLIPALIDDFHPDTQQRYKRPKELHADLTRINIAGAFETYGDEKDDLFASTDRLFEKLSSDTPKDLTDLAIIDHFLARYPQNLLHALKDKTSAENILGSIHVAERLLDIVDQHIPVGDRTFYKASIADMLGAQIPQYVAQEGVDNLGRIEAIIGLGDVFSLRSYLDFTLRHSDGIPPLPYEPENIVGQRSPDSPFLHEDENNAWSKGSAMEVLNRTAEWGDLGKMLAITDRWDREYGLTIARQPNGEMTSSFLRGVEEQIINKRYLDSRGDAVFFHSHPKKRSQDGLFAPLVSSGDVIATQRKDYGGAYLNVVCESGITLQVDTSSRSVDGPHGWVVESGELAGQTISPNGTSGGDAGPIMQQLLDTKEPFTYSIAMRKEDAQKMMFVHIPWRYLKTRDTTLESVCFGDGLEKIMSTVAPQSDGAPKNLHAAIGKAKNSLDRRPEAVSS